MGETFYRKIGKRYEPIAWHEEHDCFNEGATLVIVSRDEGHKSMNCIKIKGDVDLKKVATIGATKQVLYNLLVKNVSPNICGPSDLSDEQMAVLEDVKRVFGDKSLRLEYPSVCDVVDSAIEKLFEVYNG